MSTDNNSSIAKTGQANVGDLMVCVGSCCCISSLFTTWPECFGCSNQCSICCVESEGVCCKFADKDPTVWCILNRSQMYCQKPQTCIRGTNQVCCMDSRFAFPCTDDVPCVFTLIPCCTVCAYNKVEVGCCKSIKDMQGYREKQNEATAAN